MAMGRSNPGPSFRIPAGDMFTTTRRMGHSSPEVSTAGLTRSLASCTPAPGRPVRARAGNPRPTCASTVMTWPVTPTTATPNTLPYIRASLWPPTDRAGRLPRRAGPMPARGRSGPVGLRGSEGLFEQVNCRAARSVHRDAGHVEPDVPGNRTRRRKERLPERPELLSLLPPDRLMRGAERPAPARLDLAEHHHVAAGHDQVDLTEPASPVPRHQPVPGIAVPRERGRLARAPHVPSRSEPLHAPNYEGRQRHAGKRTY